MTEGARPSSDVDQILDRADGVMLLGGGDLDPAAYGADPHPKTYGVNDAPRRRRALFARVAVAARYARRSRSVVATRSSTSRSAARSTSTSPTATASASTARPASPAVTRCTRCRSTPTPGSRPRSARRDPSCLCHHHQAVATPAPGSGSSPVPTTASSRRTELADPDGPWIVSVQWHPEDTAADRPRSSSASSTTFARRATP